MRKIATLFLNITVLAWASLLQAGITGTISGKVVDKETGMPLPGAAIFVEGTTLGAMADKNGFYMIYNLPAGTYDVKTQMIGYSKVIMKGIRINVDLNTELNFYLSTEVLPLSEVVITQDLQLIQDDVTSSTYFISGEDIHNNLPVDSYLDAMELLPGTVGNHVRGGRETDVLYMLDGLPLQGALSREISSYLPNSSIVEMMVQTGGFTAEYGNANSGIVNVLSKNGHNEFNGKFKIYSDFLDTGITGNDNTRRLDLYVGGPLTLGLGGPIIGAKYVVSADLNLSDTAFRKKMNRAFDSPVFSNYNINSKLLFDLTNQTKLTLQGLLSNWQWREFDPQWEQNLQGLPEHQHNSNRFSASLTHTFNAKLFMALRLARYEYDRQVLGEVDPRNELIFEDPMDPSSPILSGVKPWEERTEEQINLIKWDLVTQISSNHLLKAGIDHEQHDLTFQNTRLNPIPTLGNNNGIAFSKSSNDFNFSPQFTALYIQNKLDLNRITVNLGLRYELFNPKISLSELPEEFDNLRRALQGPAIANKSKQHNPISPRLGISLPLSENERIHVNYGWFYQMPPLYHIYNNSDYNLDSYLPVFGSPDLEPIKTIASEASYKAALSDNMLFVVTGFTKTFSNLVDTQTFLVADSTISPNQENVGFSLYSNSASGEAYGFELTMQKDFTERLFGRVSYTYMKARGTSSKAEDEFERTVERLNTPEGKQFPLSWDQRHSFILDARYQTSKLQFNALYRLFSPLPVTTPGSDIPNNDRLGWRNILDIKIRLNEPLLGGLIKPFVEIRNVFDQNNIVDRFDDTGVRAYSLFDPINSDTGRRLRLGMTFDF